MLLVKDSDTMGYKLPDKKDMIKIIKLIQLGSGIDRTKFPDGLKGKIAKENWDEGIFTLGLEYGVIMALMELYKIKENELKGTA